MAEIPDPLLRGSTHEYLIDHLLERRKTHPHSDLLGFSLPPWQREEVWSPDQKTRFIEGIFLGFGTGRYIVNGLDWDESGAPLPMAGWLLDGQQRISAIRDFVRDDVEIFDGLRHKDIDPLVMLRRFKRQAFPCFCVEYGMPEDVLKDLYERLNFLGESHTESDRQRLRAC